MKWAGNKVAIERPLRSLASFTITADKILADLLQ